MLLSLWFGIILLDFMPTTTDEMTFVSLYGNMMGNLMFGKEQWGSINVQWMINNNLTM